MAELGTSRRGCSVTAVFAGWVGLVAATADLAAQAPSPNESPIPRTWTDEAIAAFELPLAQPEFSPRQISEDYYYALPKRMIWKSYPIYRPDREPDGYRDRLAALEPELAFDAATLESDQDWIDAGARVFRAPIAYDGAVRPQDVLNPAWYEEVGIDVTNEGVLPWARWVIREKGKLEVGNLACAMCHTRLMPNGSLIEGAQGNFPFEQVTAWRIRQGDTPPFVVRAISRTLAATPWIDAPMRDPAKLFQAPLEELAALRDAVPPGVLIRQGTAFNAPARIPDLIGIRDRKYLDATGLEVHRGPGDLMRYAAINQVLDILAHYGDFVPATGTSEQPPPGAARIPGTQDRYSDAQLHALARFVYSLKPPPSPYALDAATLTRGERAFIEAGCVTCHTPPLYTNNQLTPALGFTPPEDHFARYDIFDISVETDPKLATQTRRGTGYYKVPSLLGLWYRSPLLHDGSLTTLDELLDPKRLEDDFVPSGFKGAGVERRSVPGHPFGFELTEQDKEALIAYLKTL